MNNERSEVRGQRTESREGGRMSTDERLMKLLQATPEQQAAIDRILEGKAEDGGRGTEVGGQKTQVGGQRAEVGGGDVMLTKRELAARLKTTLRTVENWQRARLLPYVKIGGKAVLFHWPEVVDFLKKNFRG